MAGRSSSLWVWGLAVVLGLVPLVWGGPSLAAAQANEGSVSEAEQVLESFERSLNAHRVDAALAFFGDDAVVQHGRSFSGAGQVRRWIEQRADEGVHLHMDRYEVAGERVTWTGEMGAGEWFNRREEQPPQAVRGEAVVRNGKIVRYSLEVVGSGRDARAQSATAAVASPAMDLVGPLLGASVVLGVALLMSLWARTRRPRPLPEPPGGTQTGRLVQALGEWAQTRRR